MVLDAQPHTDFEWPIYADATLAGLSVLFPIPLVDWWLEERFRRRMPNAIARYHGQSLAHAVVQELNASDRGCLASGLLFVVKLPLELIKRLSSKILYFLTIKAATDQVSYYWQRAFLLDYALAAGHLQNVETARRARHAMERVLESTSSPFGSLARRLIGSVRDIVPTLRRGRRGQEEQVLQQERASVQQNWGVYEGFLRSLAEKYQESYRVV